MDGKNGSASPRQLPPARTLAPASSASSAERVGPRPSSKTSKPASARSGKKSASKKPRGDGSLPSLPLGVLPRPSEAAASASSTIGSLRASTVPAAEAAALSAIAEAVAALKRAGSDQRRRDEVLLERLHALRGPLAAAARREDDYARARAAVDVAEAALYGTVQALPSDPYSEAGMAALAPAAKVGSLFARWAGLSPELIAPSPSPPPSPVSVLSTIEWGREVRGALASAMSDSEMLTAELSRARGVLGELTRELPLDAIAALPHELQTEFEAALGRAADDAPSSSPAAAASPSAARSPPPLKVGVSRTVLHWQENEPLSSLRKREMAGQGLALTATGGLEATRRATRVAELGDDTPLDPAETIFGSVHRLVSERQMAASGLSPSWLETLRRAKQAVGERRAHGAVRRRRRNHAPHAPNAPPPPRTCARACARHCTLSMAVRTPWSMHHTYVRKDRAARAFACGRCNAIHSALAGALPSPAFPQARTQRACSAHMPSPQHRRSLARGRSSRTGVCIAVGIRP